VHENVHGSFNIFNSKTNKKHPARKNALTRHRYLNGKFYQNFVLQCFFIIINVYAVYISYKCLRVEFEYKMQCPIEILCTNLRQLT